MSVATLPTRRSTPATCDPRTRVTRSLLGYGILAGPFYVGVVLVQALLRPGFDLTRDDVSLLSNGSFGWVQSANFVLTGLMVLGLAAGVRRALRPGPGAAWAPRLLAVFGLGLVAAGCCNADAMNGFPAGTPAGHPLTASLHGMVHIAAAGIGFLGLISAAAVVARLALRDGDRGLARLSALTGAAFLAGFAAVASGSSSPVVVLGFWAALLLAWTWMALLALRLYRAAGHVAADSDINAA